MAPKNDTELGIEDILMLSGLGAPSAMKQPNLSNGKRTEPSWSLTTAPMHEVYRFWHHEAYQGRT